MKATIRCTAKGPHRSLRLTRTRAGEAIASVAVGSALIITLAFFVLDLIFVVLANSVNDTLARNAARAAANQQDAASASDAASKVVEDFHTSNMIPLVTVSQLDYATNQEVTVITSMNVKVPAGLPGLPAYVTFQAKDTEAIVGVPSTL